MPITGLDHIQLAMPAGEEQAARVFYGGLLGLKEIPKPSPLASRGGVWFALPGSQLHLGVETKFQPARKAHPAFLVDDLPGLREKLTRSGVNVTPDEALPQVRRFYAADPFGNRLEFIQQEDGFTENMFKGEG